MKPKKLKSSLKKLELKSKLNKTSCSIARSSRICDMMPPEDADLLRRFFCDVIDEYVADSPPFFYF